METIGQIQFLRLPWLPRSPRLGRWTVVSMVSMVLLDGALSLGLSAAIAASSASFNIGITMADLPQLHATMEPRYTPAAARRSIMRRGYGDVHLHAQSPTRYWFTAQKDNRVYKIAVSAWSGELLHTIEQ